MKATQSTDETWLPVVGYEHRYEVSNLGRVRSLPLRITNQQGSHIRPGKVLKPVPNASGHCVVNLGDGKNNRKVQYVHRLVGEAFIGPLPVGSETCHNNGDPSDNRLENLRYGTKSDNMRDAVKHGTHYQTRKTHCPQGHPYSPENTYLVGRGRKRICKTCSAASYRRRKESA